MTQEKMIQAFGRVGRSSSQKNYTLRVRDDELIIKLYCFVFNCENRLFFFLIKNLRKFFSFFKDFSNNDKISLYLITKNLGTLRYLKSINSSFVFNSLKILIGLALGLIEIK